MDLTTKPVQKAIGDFIVKSSSAKGNNAYFGYVSEKGKQSFTSGVCHGALAHTNLLSGAVADHKKEEFVLLNSFQKLSYHMKNNEKLAERFVDWLVNISPYKDMFITKDPQQIMKECYIIDPKVPNNLILGGLICSRLPTENYTEEIPKQAHVWDRFVQLGIDPTYAYLLSAFFRMSDGESITYNPISNNHWPLFPGDYSEEYSLSFLTGTQQRPEKSLQETGFVRSAKIMWLPKNKDYNGDFGNRVARFKPKSGTKIVNYNIFFKEKMSNFYKFVSDDELVELANSVLEWIVPKEKKVA